MTTRTVRAALSAELRSTLLRIEKATTPLDLFPSGATSTATAKLYRSMATVCHPDKFNGKSGADTKLHARVEDAFKKLTRLYKELTAPPPLPSVGKWLVDGVLHKGHLCDLYRVHFGDAHGVLRIVRKPSDNPLLVAEAKALKRLADNGKMSTYTRYFPTLLDKFEASGRMAVITTEAADCLPLTAIRKQFPTGIPFRHVVWMFNRLLSALGSAHNIAATIHGAVLPPHLLYRPADHGLVLADWSCSVPCPSDGHIPFIVKEWRYHYPVEVRKKDAYFSTDIYMAAAAMRYAAGGVGQIPRRFRAFFDWLLAESPSARPSDAWEIQDRWKALAAEEYGKPTFVKLEIPAN